jgi:hypothetical protein
MTFFASFALGNLAIMIMARATDLKGVQGNLTHV